MKLQVDRLGRHGSESNPRDDRYVLRYALKIARAQLPSGMDRIVKEDYVGAFARCSFVSASSLSNDSESGLKIQQNDKREVAST